MDYHCRRGKVVYTKGNGSDVQSIDNSVKESWKAFNFIFYTTVKYKKDVENTKSIAFMQVKHLN